MVERHGKATLHCLRDTFCTRMIEAGLDLEECRVLLRQASTSMTRKYANWSPKVADKAIAAVNRLRKAQDGAV